MNVNREIFYFRLTIIVESKDRDDRRSVAVSIYLRRQFASLFDCKFSKFQLQVGLDSPADLVTFASLITANQAKKNRFQ